MKKGLIIVGPGWIALAHFWVPDDIESCRFQNLLIFRFPETSQNLMSFRQLLISLFHGGTKGENLKTPEICQKGAKAIQPGPTMIGPFVRKDKKWRDQSAGKHVYMPLCFVFELNCNAQGFTI